MFSMVMEEKEYILLHLNPSLEGQQMSEGIINSWPTKIQPAFNGQLDKATECLGRNDTKGYK